MKNLFKNLHFTEHTDKHQVKVLRVCKRSVVTFFLHFLPQWKRKGNTPLDLPSLITLPKSHLKSFIRSFFSAEGSVILGCKWHKHKKLWVINKRIQATSKNDSLKNFVAEALKKLGFSPVVWKREVALTRKKDILRFTKEIRFFRWCKNISKKPHMAWNRKK
jgi:hypothetical protein